MDFKTLTNETIKDRDEWTDNFFSTIIIDEDEKKKLEEQKEPIYREIQPLKVEDSATDSSENSLDIFDETENTSKKNFTIFAILIALIVLISFLCGMLVSKIINKASSYNDNSYSYGSTTDV